MNNRFQWFALRVRSRFEKVAAKDLHARGFEVCAACAPVSRIWADRVRVVEMPIFPGYIFARFDPSRAWEAMSAAGVVSIVGFGSQCCSVDDREMDAIRLVLASGVEVLRETALRPGARVRVCHGSLKDIEGVLEEVKSERRLVISVTLLQRSVAVEISDLLVEPVEPVKLSWRKATAA